VFDPKTLIERGLAALSNRQPEQACDLFAQAVAEARWVNDPAVLAQALMTLGQTEHSLQHPATALDSYREAAAVCAQAGDAAGQAEALAETAKVLRAQGKTNQAEAACEQLLELLQPLPDPPALVRARALRMLALLKEKTASEDELLLLWHAAATLYEADEKPERAAECHAHLAFLMGR
jgi:tetratricopeptide (TPR) repeat protein